MSDKRRVPHIKITDERKRKKICTNFGRFSRKGILDGPIGGHYTVAYYHKGDAFNVYSDFRLSRFFFAKVRG